MFNVFDPFTQHHPVAARRLMAAANSCMLVLPAATILAIVTGHLVLAQVGVFASIASYATGYAAAGVRYGRRLRAAVTEARRDPLTGLPTRPVADEILGAATRDATAMTVALADIDGLHAINTLGLAAGDQYIKVIAERLARAVPPGGCLVRQGGDEFTLLAPGTDPDELATAIGAAMAGPAVIAEHRIQPRVSVGIAHSGGADANYARACADAAMFIAKAAGGNHIMVYQPDRDGLPRADGTRPLIRRRDINPLAHDGVAWLPTPGDDLLPLLVSVDEARTLGEAVSAAQDRWAQAGAEAHAGAQCPETPPSTEPDRMNIEPTPASHRGIARIAADLHARYTRIADRLAQVIDATQAHGDTGHAPRPSSGTSGVVLVGISAGFTPIEIEGLVRTAAEVICDCQVCRLVRTLSGSL